MSMAGQGQKATNPLFIVAYRVCPRYENSAQIPHVPFDRNNNKIGSALSRPLGIWGLLAEMTWLV